MSDVIEKIVALESPTASLEALKLGERLNAPNFQRLTVETTIRRIKDKSSKRFSCKRINDYYFTVLRSR